MSSMLIYGNDVAIGNNKLPRNNLTHEKWTQTNNAIRVDEKTLYMDATADSRIISNTSGYFAVTAGQLIRFSIRVANLTTLNHRLQISISELSSPYSETSVIRSIHSNGLFCVEHTATQNCNIAVFLGNLSGSPGTVELSDVWVEVKTGDTNSLFSFGDSIGAGSKLAGNLDDAAGCYTALFASSKNIPYLNFSTSGDNLYEILTTVQSKMGTVGSITAHPETIFVEGGANDLFESSSDCTASMQAAVISICEIGVAAGSNIVLFDIPLLNLSGDKEIWRTVHNSWLSTYATANGHKLVPLSTIVDNPEYYEVPADNTHFNTAGHQKIVDFLIANGISYGGDSIPITDYAGITLTQIKHGDTATPVADINRVVQTKSELSSSQINKQMNEDLK